MLRKTSSKTCLNILSSNYAVIYIDLSGSRSSSVGDSIKIVFFLSNA